MSSNACRASESCVVSAKARILTARARKLRASNRSSFSGIGSNAGTVHWVRHVGCHAGAQLRSQADSPKTTAAPGRIRLSSRDLRCHALGQTLVADSDFANLQPGVGVVHSIGS